MGGSDPAPVGWIYDSGMADSRQRAGPLFRWTRRLLILLAGLTLFTWVITTTGLYFWFNVGAENRLRFEYGRIVWRHVDGGTARSSAGVDGGANKALWSYERADYGSHQITRIPLWMPFLLFVGGAFALTHVRRIRARRSLPLANRDEEPRAAGGRPATGR